VEILETVGQGVKGVDMVYTYQSPEFCFRATQPCRSKMQPIMLFLASSRPSRRTQTCQPSRTTQPNNIKTISRGHSTRNGAFQLQYPNFPPNNDAIPQRAGALSTLAATPPLPPDSRSHDISAQQTLSNPTDPTPSHAPRRAPPQQDAYPVSGGILREKVSEGEAC